MFSLNSQKASDNKNDSYQNQLLNIDTIWHSHYGRDCKMLPKNYVILPFLIGMSHESKKNAHL